MLHRLLAGFGRAFPDARLALLARLSVADDPLLADLTRVRITCTGGVIRLKGRVPQASDKLRIEADIQGALATAGLPYVGIRNALQANAMDTRSTRVDRPVLRAPLLDAR
jgi:hypothetical protein